MTGKVVELETQLGGDSVAASVTETYSTWRNQRRTWISEKKELRNYIFATDTSKTSNASLPWKNSTTIPKICQIRDNLHANYMAALFPNDEWLRWEGHAEDDDSIEKANAIEAYMKNKLVQSGFQETVARILYDYIDYGNAISDCEYVTIRSPADENGDIEDIYIGPRAVRVSPLDIEFNPASAKFDDTAKITRVIKTLGELKLEAITHPELSYNLDIIAEAETFRRNLGLYEQADWDKAEGISVDGFGSLQEYYQSNYVEILELEGSIHDVHTGEFQQNRLITVIDRSRVIRNIPNPSWTGGSSKSHAGWRLRPDNLWAMGPLDNLVGMQYRIDHLENLKADVFDLIAHPPLVIRGDVNAFTWGPYAKINITSEDGDVKILKLDTTALNADLQIANLMQIMEEMAGSPKNSMGIRTPGEKTAFEVQSLENAAGRIFQQKITYFEKNILEPLLNNMLEKARRNLNMKDTIRVMDDDFGVAEFLEITKEDLSAKGKLRPMGARHFSARAQLLQNLSGVFSGTIGKLVIPHTNTLKLTKLVEDILSIEKFSLFSKDAALVEQAESAKLANTLKDNVDNEAITPVEGEPIDGTQ